MFQLFVVLSLSTANVYVSTSKSVVVDLSSQTDLNLYVVSSNAIVQVSTTNGFDITAYDKDDTQIGKLSSSSPVIQLGPISGKLYVKKTGTQTKFACSVIIVSNLPIGKQCESVLATNNAQQDLTLTNSKLTANKVNCIWLSSTNTMSTQVSVNVQGTVDAFIPGKYEPYSTVSNSGSIQISADNTLLVVKLTNTNSPSIVIKSSGQNPSYVELSNASFTADGNASIISGETTPTPQPSQPTTQPTQPTSQPTQPTTQPTQPTQPTSKPTQPTSQPTQTSSKSSPTPNSPTTSTSSDDSQSGNTPSGNGSKKHTGLIVALVIMTILMVIAVTIALFLFLKLRVVVTAGATLI